jgi:hypothetical protein
MELELKVIKTTPQHRIKIIAVLCLIKGSCVFVTFDFPSKILAYKPATILIHKR